MDTNYARWRFGDSFQIQVLALSLRDPEFLSQYIDVLDHTYFEHQDLSTLGYLVFAYFKANGKPPHRDSLEVRIKEYALTYDKDGSQKLEARLVHWLGYVYDREIDEEFITTRVVKFGKRQAIKKAMAQCIDFLDQEKPIDEDDDLAEKVNRKIEEACSMGTGRDLGIVWSDIALKLPEIIRDSITYKTKVPTGLPKLDALLNGGIGAGEIGVVMGPPNKGKSTILTWLGAYASFYLYGKALRENTPPKAVIHITCEMGDKAIALKYGASITNLSIPEVRLGRDYVEKATPQIAKQAPLYIKHFPPGSTSAEMVKWYIANLLMVKNVQPGIIILDYADRLKGGEDDRFKGMGQIYDQLISMSLKFECPVWTGSQVRRFNANDELIDSTGAAESWKKIEASDVVISLNQKQTEYQDNVMRLYLTKVRDGQAQGVVFTHFDTDRVQLRELTDAEIKEQEEKAQSTASQPGSVPNPSAYKRRKKEEPSPAPVEDPFTQCFEAMKVEQYGDQPKS